MRRAVAVLVLAGLSYRLFLRRPVLTWGATPEEAGARLPGDELLEAAGGIATRAITIDAPPSAVWPWIAQMGPSPRGGAYTYDWIENLLGLNMHSVDEVLPEFQHPRVGDTIGYGRNRMRLFCFPYAGGSIGFCIVGRPHAARVSTRQTNFRTHIALGL